MNMFQSIGEVFVLGWRTVLALPLAWLAAGLVGARLQWNLPSTVTTISFLALGGLVAADAKLSDGIVAGLAEVLIGTSGRDTRALASLPKVLASIWKAVLIL